MLNRILEPEVMDTADEALAYDQMDHRAVNDCFVQDLDGAGGLRGDVLDLGCGTAQLPVLICEQFDDVRIMATDLSKHMLDLARYNVEAAGLIDRIQLAHADAKALEFEDVSFDAIVSNSIVHHIPDPQQVLVEAVRVAKPGALLFFRDLLRPNDTAQLDALVVQYAGAESEHAQQLFRDSLHAALSLDEMRALVADLDCNDSQVAVTSDRHWTWTARRAG